MENPPRKPESDISQAGQYGDQLAMQNDIISNYYATCIPISLFW